MKSMWFVPLKLRVYYFVIILTPLQCTRLFSPSSSSSSFFAFEGYEKKIFHQDNRLAIVFEGQGNQFHRAPRPPFSCKISYIYRVKKKYFANIDRKPVVVGWKVSCWLSGRQRILVTCVPPRY